MGSFIFYTSSKSGRSLCPTLYYHNFPVRYNVIQYSKGKQPLERLTQECVDAVVSVCCSQ